VTTHTGACRSLPVGAGHGQWVRCCTAGGGADPTSSDQARSLAPRLPAKRLVAQTDRLPPIPTGKSAPSVPFWGRRRRRLASGANSRARRWPIGDLDAPSKPSEFLALARSRTALSKARSVWSGQLAGSVEEPHCCRKPTAPPLLPTNNRPFWGPEHTPLETLVPPWPAGGST
jgi:hypothetical protein